MVCGVKADVRKPLASVVRVAKAGIGIWLEAHGVYIENLATKERMEVREEKRCLRDGRAVRR